MKAVVAIVVVLGLGSAFSQEAAAADWQDLPVTPALGPVVGRHLEKIADPGGRLGNLPGPECDGLAAVSCEMRLLRPSVALIMFGTNDLKSTTAVRFRGELARVARLVSGAGTIPVLSTIPPRAQQTFVGRVGGFNEEIAGLADNRVLPLWNFWRQLAAPGVPDEGLGPDGVHPSVLCPPCTAIDFWPAGLRQGYALRNLGALRMLDRLRREVPLEEARPSG